MAILVLDPDVEAELIASRPDERYIEVWEGLSVMSPSPNTEHQTFVPLLCAACLYAVGNAGRVLTMPNVSDRDDGWTKNYRCPDVAVYLNTNPAIDRGAHFQGGPDLAVEIVSRGEDPLAKLGFYAAVGTRELLIVERDPWALELFRLSGGVLTSVGRIEAVGSPALGCDSLGLTFRLVAGQSRPAVEVVEPATARTWLA